MSIRLKSPLKRRHHRGKPKHREFSDVPLLSQSSTSDTESYSSSIHSDDQESEENRQQATTLGLDIHDAKPLEEILLNDESTKYVRLKRQLGLLSAISVIVNSMIGSGIFVSPKGVILHAGSIGLSMIVWTICGMFSLVGSLCYAELGTSLPYSGGIYIYINEIFGGLLAFLTMWISVLIRSPVGAAVVSLTFAFYTVQNFFEGYPVPQSATRLIAAVLILFLTFINCYNVKLVTRLQTFFMFGKLLALGLIIVMGIVQLCKGRTENFHDMFQGTTHDPGQIALAIYAGMWAYSGWDMVNCLTEEIRNPSRTLPIAIAIAIPLVTIVYLLTNLAYFTALTPQEMIASDATAVVYAGRVLGPMAWIMPVFVAMSTLGSVNTLLLSCSRVLFAGARVGHLPSYVSMVNPKYLTPMVTLLVLCFFSLCMLVSSDVYKMITYLEFIESSLLAVPIIGMLYLRWKQPELERPLKVWLFIPAMYLLIALFLVIFPWYDSPVETAIGVAMVVSGIPVYFVMFKWEKKPKWIGRSSIHVQRFLQKLFYLLPEDNQYD
ncbi:Y+L amino acid transporter 2-like [Lineus longissimus]|uniref:Y+L amino acid transporter 2-like n=1 Tax=Lineus longissimus TaxID=88925 RepID=UPI00315D32F6